MHDTMNRESKNRLRDVNKAGCRRVSNWPAKAAAAVVTFAFALGGAATALGDEPANADKGPDYATEVAPIFAKYCNGCHNADDQEGELVLETYDALRKGGQEGAIVAPGEVNQSRLILVLTGRAEPATPPEDNYNPTHTHIATLAAWIAAGARGPSGGEPADAPLVTPKIKPAAPVVEAITSVAFAPDGKTLAVARYNMVEILSLPERSLLRRLGPHEGRVNAVRYSTDGKSLVAAAGEPGIFGEATLWNVARGIKVRAVRGHKDSLYAAVLSPNGQLLATSSYDQEIQLWDAATGESLRTLSGHNGAVFDLSFRPDGKTLASASGDRTAKLWDVASGERLETFGQPLQDLYCVAFSPDGKRVAAGGVDNRIRVWQVSPAAKENTNPLLHSRFAHEGAVVKLAYSKDGKTLVSAGEDRTVKVWDAEPMNERLALERQSDWAGALDVSPDGKVVAIGRLDGSLAFYSLADGKEQPAPPQPKPELASLSLRGVQSGTTTRVVLRGKHLAEVTAVKASDKSVDVALVEVRDGMRVAVDVTPSPDMHRAKVELWAENAAGASNRKPVMLDELPQAQEAEPNDTLAAAQSITLGSGTWGVLSKQGDADWFAFDAFAGQNLVFEVAAAEIGSKANVVLTLHDAAGRVVADQNDFGGSPDPLLAYTVPADARYVVSVRDLTRAGGPEHYYRLSVGEFAVVTGTFPISIPQNTETEVALVGHNVPPESRVKLPAAEAGEVVVPLDAKQFRWMKPLKVVVGTLPEIGESEPNDAPATADAISLPATVNGRMLAADTTADDHDYFRFASKAGQQWIIETDAARRGSPVDTVVDVLDAEGKSIPRVLLQAVRDSTVTFRGIDGNNRDCRLTNWEEMQLNQLLYLNGEVVKLFRAPRGPDSGFLFYEGIDNRRRCYFDTSGTVHAVDEPCYIVEPHAPGTKLINTGLPVITLAYTNDDDGMRRFGSDSWLHFTAPADGDYLVRVRDARGAGGDRFAYRLTVRPPEPGFKVTLNGVNPSVASGSGTGFTVSVDRIDGFEGEVVVTIDNLPEGFRALSPLVIQQGHREAAGVLFAAPDAKQPSDEALEKITVEAKATVDGKEVVQRVNNFGKIKLQPKPKLLVTLEPAEITLAPGSSVVATLRVERNGYNDLIKFELENLPHGVIVADIGLSGVMMPKGETERQIFIQADSWVPETDRLGFAKSDKEGNQCSAPVLVRVRNDAPLADAAPATPATGAK